jgi:hypothetical protein
MAKMSTPAALSALMLSASRVSPKKTWRVKVPLGRSATIIWAPST